MYLICRIMTRNLQFAKMSLHIFYNYGGELYFA